MELQPGRLYTNNTAELEEIQRVRRWKGAFLQTMAFILHNSCLILYWL